MTKQPIVLTHPEIANQWHPTLNADLTPNDVSSGSNLKIWWKCDKGDDHEWLSQPNSRIGQKQGCPVCSNKKIVTSNCLATTHPEIANQWHPTKNGSLTPFKIVAGSHKKVWWQCPKGDDHIYFSSVGKRTGLGRSCPYCAGRQVCLSNSLFTMKPELAKEWHPIKNGKLTPKDIYAGSLKKVWWKCNKGDDHEYEMSLSNRNRGQNCPICRGLRVIYSTSLEFTNPELLKDWDYNRNKIKPSDITVNSNKKVWWKCDVAYDHIWMVDPNSRHTQKSECPFCSLTPQSKQELTITFELMQFFKNIDPKGFKTRLNGRLRAIDIYVPKLNLCIEFDGSYWHKDKVDIDKIKSEMLLEEGFSLIRVREVPLKKIYDTDVISKQPYDGKQVINDILSMILTIYKLDLKLVQKIKLYQSKNGLQNAKGLEKYIDKILTEKSKT